MIHPVIYGLDIASGGGYGIAAMPFLSTSAPLNRRAQRSNSNDSEWSTEAILALLSLLAMVIMPCATLFVRRNWLRICDFWVNMFGGQVRIGTVYPRFMFSLPIFPRGRRC